MRRDAYTTCRGLGAFGVMVRNNSQCRPQCQHQANHRCELYEGTHFEAPSSLNLHRKVKGTQLTFVSTSSIPDYLRYRDHLPVGSYRMIRRSVSITSLKQGPLIRRLALVFLDSIRRSSSSKRSSNKVACAMSIAARSLHCSANCRASRARSIRLWSLLSMSSSFTTSRECRTPSMVAKRQKMPASFFRVQPLILSSVSSEAQRTLSCFCNSLRCSIKSPCCRNAHRTSKVYPGYSYSAGPTTQAAIC